MVPESVWVRIKGTDTKTKVVLKQTKYFFAGKRFAMCQSKVAIVELIRNFNITVNGKTQQPILIDPKEFITFPKGGYWLNYTSIEI